MNMFKKYWMLIAGGVVVFLGAVGVSYYIAGNSKTAAVPTPAPSPSVAPSVTPEPSIAPSSTPTPTAALHLIPTPTIKINAQIFVVPTSTPTPTPTPNVKVNPSLIKQQQNY